MFGGAYNKLLLALLSCSTFIANHRSSIPLEQFATSSYADLSSNQELYGIEQANYCYFEFGEKGLSKLKFMFTYRVGVGLSLACCAKTSTFRM